MASSPVLDLEALLVALPDAPCGPNLRADSSPGSIYYRIKDARNASRSAEKAIDSGEPDAQPPRWRDVLEHSQQALRERSKDLEIVAWLIEALVREHGFAGLRDGFALALALVERFWDDLHPRPDEDGLLTRVAPLAGLNGVDGEGTLVRPIAMATIIEGRERNFSSWNWRKAVSISSVADEQKRDAQIASSGVSRSAIEAAASGLDADALRATFEDVEGALERWNALGKKLEELCADAAPSTANIRGALEAVRDDLKQIAGDRLAANAPEEAAADDASASGDGQKSGARARAGGPIDTRDDAFRALTQVAEYFRRTEPHSPVAYLLDQSVRWGRLPLHELLPELIPDDGAREHFCKLTGIRTARE